MSTHPARPSTLSAKRISAALCALGALLAVGGVASSAASFNDSVTAGVTADVGTVEVTLNGPGGVEEVDLTFHDLTPGAVQVRELRAIDRGTLPAALTVHVDPAPGVASELTYQVGVLRTVTGTQTIAWFDVAPSFRIGRADQLQGLRVSVPADLDRGYQGRSGEAKVTLTLEAT